MDQPGQLAGEDAHSGRAGQWLATAGHQAQPIRCAGFPRSSTTLATSAGCSALTMKVAGSGFHGMMSIFSHGQLVHHGPARG